MARQVHNSETQPTVRLDAALHARAHVNEVALVVDGPSGPVAVTGTSGGAINVNSGGGGGGGAVTIADGADVTQGAIADAAVTSDAAGTVNAHLRGLVAILANVWNSVAGRFRVEVHDGGNVISVDDAGGSLTVDGTVTVNQGTSPWVVGDGAGSLTTDSVDGGHVTLGATTDAAATGNGTVIGLLKRIRDLLGTLAGKSTATIRTSVPGSTSAVTILATNANRIGAVIYNDSTAVLHLAFGSAASTTDYSVRMNSQSVVEVPYNYTGIITGVWASATGDARVTEFT